MIIVYTGNGKGKTSAALGTVLRASGYIKRSGIIQFVKDGTQYGEHHAVRHYLNDVVDMFQAGIGFHDVPGDDQEEIDHEKAVREAMELAYRILESEKYDLLVLDEILTAAMAGLVGKEAILKLVRTVPDDVHCILTGRGAERDIIEYADLVTEMQEVKHPFQKHKNLTEGIDY